MKKYVENFKKLVMSVSEDDIKRMMKLKHCPFCSCLDGGSCVDCWNEILKKKLIATMSEDELEHTVVCKRNQQ